MQGAGDLEEFQLVRPIGRGGMGEVYLGHDTILDRAVAIKLIGATNPDATSRDRFLTEARAIARLSHPNVVNIFRVGATGDGRPFLVQELIRGRSLDQVPRPLPARQVCELAIGIARGLDAAHRHSILHRDVKPANVMLDDSGRARLLDFGLAKLTASEVRPLRPAASPRGSVEDDVAVTRDATPADVPSDATLGTATTARRSEILASDGVVGTPRYTAPEIWRGEPATVKSDLYSLGVMLYELAAGSAPYPQTDIVELERAVLAGGARPLDELAPEVPAILARLVMRCVATDPAARPGSAAEIAHELESVLVDAASVPEGNPYRGLRPFDAAHRRLFFGRGTDVGVLVDRLRTEALVVVAGDSGIGKSSVCHAGVVPAVLAGGLGDHRRWRAVTMVPGRRPWSVVRDLLALGDTEDALRAVKPAAGEGVLLVVDQLEELVTIADPVEAERAARLFAAIADGVPGIKAVLSVRGDFLTRVAALPELGGAIARGLHLLRVLAAADLREAVLGPARTTGIAFESPEMVEDLVGAVAGNPGALPLLQFTLAELWRARDVEHGVIQKRTLDALGGVEGGLAAHANAVVHELGAEQRVAARRILLRLVTSQHTRAIRERDELIGADDPAGVAALESLVRGRLVVARDTVEGKPEYELAHEALIRSWGTLRDWLDAAAGQHAARNRLIAGAAEWERLGRRPELLWGRRQLDEVADARDLTPQERAFVGAARAQLRRRWLARVAAIAAVPVLATVIYLGVRFEAARRRDREVAARIATATEHRTMGERLAAEAARVRALAFEHFEAARTNDGESTWAVALGLSRAADGAYREATGELEGAFMIEPNAVRAPMARTLWAHAELAEARHDRELVRDLLNRLTVYDRTQRARWAIPARVTITADAPATLTLHVSSPTGKLAGGFDATPIASGSQLDLELREGSYLVVAKPTGGEEVRYPIAITRGEKLVQTIAMPRTSVPGFVFVPAGRFLIGTDRDEVFRRDYQRTTPLHTSRTASYWISRTEVTFGEWIEFLRDLPADQREKLLPNSPGNQRAVRLHERVGRFELEFDPHNTLLRAIEGQPLVYTDRDNAAVRWDRLPVVGVTSTASTAYAAWLHRSGRVPNARLCTVGEWERAARGADGRAYPHGSALGAKQANHDVTYKRVGFGLDEVGSFPASDSPFGVHDLAGNASESVVLADGFGMKGGSYFHSALTAMSSNNSPATKALTLNYFGVRLCADVAR